MISRRTISTFLLFYFTILVLAGQETVRLDEYITQASLESQYFLEHSIKDDEIIDSEVSPQIYLPTQGYDLVLINEVQYLVIPEDFIISKPVTPIVSDAKLWTIGQPSNQSNCKINGLAVDGGSGEGIIGATIYNEEMKAGTTTDYNGNFTLECKCNEAQNLIITSVGYEETSMRILALGDAQLDLTLYERAELIDEIVIGIHNSDDNVQSSVSGLSQLSMQEIKNLPNLLGEPDVMKSLLTLSGVTNAGEGASGINVRGGNADQNLILLDEMTFFNPTHSFGFFSAIHPDMVSDLELYKGVMPAEYGGRLSSVLQTKSTRANLAKWKSKIGLGLISTKAYVEGPLWKDRTSIAFAARLSHLNWLLNTIENTDVNQSRTNFYDLHGKLTHHFVDNLKVTIQGYQSKDGFRFTDQFDVDYITRNASIELNYIPTNNLSIKIGSSIGKYESTLTSLNISDLPQLNSGIDNFKQRIEGIYELGANFVVKAGLEYTNHPINPGVLNAGDGTIISGSKTQKATSINPYASIVADVTKSINVTAGLRYPDYQRRGPESEIQYVGNPVLNQSEQTTKFDKRAEVYRFSQLEPRIGITFKLIEDLSFKVSYNKTSQFISQISNTASPTPIDFWMASNQYIQPMTASAYSLGLYNNWKDDTFTTSVEGYYKDIDNVTETIDFADIIANLTVETQLLQGIGKTYGVEVNLDKSVGDLTGKLNYTYSRSLRQVRNDNPELQINNGAWYSANFDKPHSLNLNMKYEIGKRSSVAMAFTYSTGRPVTVPISVYENFDVTGIYVFSDRNAFRIPNYHRLDIAYDYYPNIKKNRSYKTFWSFGLYNVYGRNNAYSVFFEQSNGSPPKANSLAIIGVPLPSITLNIEFE